MAKNGFENKAPGGRRRVAHPTVGLSCGLLYRYYSAHFDYSTKTTLTMVAMPPACPRMKHSMSTSHKTKSHHVYIISYHLPSLAVRRYSPVPAVVHRHEREWRQHASCVSRNHGAAATIGHRGQKYQLRRVSRLICSNNLTCRLVWCRVIHIIVSWVIIMTHVDINGTETETGYNSERAATKKVKRRFEQRSNLETILNHVFVG